MDLLAEFTLIDTDIYIFNTNDELIDRVFDLNNRRFHESEDCHCVSGTKVLIHHDYKFDGIAWDVADRTLSVKHNGKYHPCDNVTESMLNTLKVFYIDAKPPPNLRYRESDVCSVIKNRGTNHTWTIHDKINDIKTTCVTISNTVLDVIKYNLCDGITNITDLNFTVVQNRITNIKIYSDIPGSNDLLAVLNGVTYRIEKYKYSRYLHIGETEFDDAEIYRRAKTALR